MVTPKIGSGKLTKEQRDLVFSKIDYHPTFEQEEIHDCENRLRLVAGGERSGKSKLSAMDLVAHMFFGTLFWLVAADYERTRQEFDYICEALAKLKIRFSATKRVDPGEIIIEDFIKIVTKSAKDPRTLAMTAPWGILVCEASQIDYETYLRLRGRLAEYRGWMLMSGTFEGSLGWYVEAYQRGQVLNDEDLKSFSMPTWSNINIFPGGRDDPELKAIEAQSTKEWFLERYGGVPTPPRGTVFSEFRNHLHTGTGKDYELNLSEYVYLFVDPGYASAYAVEVAQKRGEYIYIIDEIYERNMTTSDIIKVAKTRPWWNRVIGGAIDIAGTQHQAMPAPSEIWLREGGVTLRSNKVKIQDGIERVKNFLIINPITSSPLLHINLKCRGLISEMGGCLNPITGETAVYRWKTDSTGNTQGDTPDDRNNHAAKALAYGIVDLFGYSEVRLKKIKVKFF